MSTTKTAVVVPTIRYNTPVWETFLDAWKAQFEKHSVYFIAVYDGPNPVGVIDFPDGTPQKSIALSEVPEVKGLITRMSPAVRNFGFYLAAKVLNDVEYIVTLDDDVVPFGDTIGDHIKALGLKASYPFLNTFSVETPYFPRGFPYANRNTVPVIASHGVWHGVKDWDAMTQLVIGNPDVEFYKGLIPWGYYVPVCGMNFAFSRLAFPYVYYAPAKEIDGAGRFDDIWMGYVLQHKLETLNATMVSGFSAVHHTRASNPYENLKQEYAGIGINETFLSQVKTSEYWYKKAYDKWIALMI